MKTTHCCSMGLSAAAAAAACALQSLPVICSCHKVVLILCLVPPSESLVPAQLCELCLTLVPAFERLREAACFWCMSTVGLGAFECCWTGCVYGMHDRLRSMHLAQSLDSIQHKCVHMVRLMW